MVYFLLSLIQNKPSHKAIYIQRPIKVNILAGKAQTSDYTKNWTGCPKEVKMYYYFHIW